MRETLNEPISVALVFAHEKGTVQPWRLKWRGRHYLVSQVGYHHSYRQGETLVHVFEVVAGDQFFRLVLDTATLHWRLEAVADGLPA